MDILDTQIKGITGKIAIGFTCVVAAVVGGYFATTGQIKDSEHRIMTEIRADKADQRLTDTLQNRDILEIQKKLLVNK